VTQVKGAADCVLYDMGTIGDSDIGPGTPGTVFRAPVISALHSKESSPQLTKTEMESTTKILIGWCRPSVK